MCLIKIGNQMICGPDWLYGIKGKRMNKSNKHIRNSEKFSKQVVSERFSLQILQMLISWEWCSEQKYAIKMADHRAWFNL